MINVSDEFKTLMEERTDFKQNAVITFEDGTSLELGEEDFTLSTNNTVTDGADAGGLPLGEAVCRSIQVELMNDEDQLAAYSFTGAKIRLYPTFALSETTEKVELGTFTVVSPEVYSTTVIITAVDDMYLADRAYSSSLTYPTTLRQMFLEIVDLCGLAYTTANFNNYDYSVSEAPDSSYTCREVLGFIAMIAGGNAHIDREGYLEILSYDFDGEDRHELVNWKSLTLDASDITITGVQNTVTVDEKDKTYLYGEEGYVLAVENPLIYGDEDNALALMGANLVGRSFRKFEGTHIAYPLAEFMDLCTMTDWKGNVYQSVITDVNFVFFGLTTLRNSAESGLRNASEYNSAGTMAVIAAKKLAAVESSAREAAVKALQESLSTASGLYATAEKQDDGSTIYYLHDKPTLAESANVIKLTAETIGFSTDGGETYPYGFTVNGDVIAKLLYAEGINADYITTGALKVSDDDGNILLYASPGENTFYINAPKFSLDPEGNVIGTSGKLGGWIIDNYRLTAELTALETTTETVYVTDDDGNYIQETDGDGNPLYYTDDTESETTTEETEWPVYQTEIQEVTSATGYNSYTILNALKSSGSNDIAISIGATDPDDLTTGAIRMYSNGYIYTPTMSFTDGIYPTKTDTYSLGSTAHRWNYVRSKYLEVSNNITVSNGGAIYLKSAYSTNLYLYPYGSTEALRIVAYSTSQLQILSGLQVTNSIIGNNKVVAGTTTSYNDGVPGVQLESGGNIIQKSSGSPNIYFYPNGTTSSPIRLVASSSGLSLNNSFSVTGNGAFSGSLSTYGYTVPRMLTGSVSVSVTASTATEFSVNFSTAFPGTPRVFFMPVHNSNVGDMFFKVKTRSSTGFTGLFYSTTAGTHTMDWLATYG